MEIKGIRTFARRTKVKFGSPLTIICGKNGAGKSTLLEAIKVGIVGVFPSGTKGGRGFFSNQEMLQTPANEE